MTKEWKLIAVFAAVGLLIAVSIFLYISRANYFDETLFTPFVIFCPPSLLCFPFSEVMKHESGLYIIWSLIGFLNSGLYALVGATIAGLRKSN